MSTRGRVLNVIGIGVVIAAGIAFLFGDFPVAVVVVLIGGFLLWQARLTAAAALRPGQIK